MTKRKPRKVWICVKVGLSRQSKHRRKMGEGLWLYLYLLDHADWETGIVTGFRDENCAADIDASVSWVRKWRRALTKEQYINVTRRGSLGQDITINKWLSPRTFMPPPSVTNEPLSTKESDTIGTLTGDESDTNVIPLHLNSDMESATQSDTDSITNAPLLQAQTEQGSSLIDQESLKDSNSDAPQKKRRSKRQPKTPPTPRARTDLEKAVIEGIFQIPGDAPLENGYLAGAIVNWLKANAPDESPDDVRQFCRWYAKHYPGAAMPRDIAKVEPHYLAYMAARDNHRVSVQSTVPTMRKPEIEPGPIQTPEERQAIYQRMQEARRAEQQASAAAA